MKKIATILASALILATSYNASAKIINFSDLTLDTANSYWNGSDQSGMFTSNGIVYYNVFESTYKSYSGATYSNCTDYTNGTLYTGNGQYVSSTGGALAADGSLDKNGIYSVVYVDSYSTLNPYVDFSGIEEEINAIYISNTALAVDVLTSPKYTGNVARPFAAGDWFKLTISALDGNGEDLGSVDFYLADFRDGKTYVADTWTAVSLVAFNGKAEFLNFAMSSSDNANYAGVDYMNTPSYIAIGGFDTVAVPEPSVIAFIFGISALVIAAYRRK